MLKTFCNNPRNIFNTLYYTFQFHRLLTFSLKRSLSSYHCTVLRTPKAFNTIIQSNCKSSLAVCTWTVFPYIAKISAIIGLVSFPTASTIMSLSSTVSSFYIVSFPKFIYLVIFAAFVADLAARFFFVLSAFLSFASPIPCIKFRIVSSMTNLGPDKYHLPASPHHFPRRRLILGQQ